MAVVTVRNLQKSFGKVQAVNGISFEIAEGELVTLLGESGCGKTTTLRLIAGLEENDKGEILLRDRVVSDPARSIFLPPEKRNIGMVFQSYAIWPHMTVFENIAFPLRIQRVSSTEIRERVEKILEMMGLENLPSRLATRLSGGQQQRVAIARALTCSPEILLMDEPLSNLDAKLRERMRFELRDLQMRLGIATIYVTHDQAEAMVLSDRIVVMDEGRVEQIGTPQEIYERPQSRFVSDFIGMANLMPGGVRELKDGVWRLRISLNGRELNLCTEKTFKPGPVLALVRPENVEVGKVGKLPNENTWPAIVEVAAYFGDHREYILRDGDLTVRAKTAPNVILQRGESVELHIPRESPVIVGEGSRSRLENVPDGEREITKGG